MTNRIDSNPRLTPFTTTPPNSIGNVSAIENNTSADTSHRSQGSALENDLFERATVSVERRPATPGIQRNVIGDDTLPPNISSSSGALIARHQPASRNSGGVTASGAITSNNQPTDGVQRPPVRWTGGVQHNGNNPEVVVQLGRSYSSRPLAPEGVGFNGGSQRVFSSSKNLTGSTMNQSLVLSNPGNAPMQLKVSMSVTDPRNIQPSTQNLTIPPGGSMQIPVASARDKGFIAFDAQIEALNDAAKKGKIDVDVVAHSPNTRDPASRLASMPLMPTEGERGFRIPASRLSDNPAYTKEVRFVMAAAGDRDALDPAKVSDANVKAYVSQQTEKARAGQPNLFDPAVNRGILGRVNGLVSATAGEVQASPLDLSLPRAESTVRIRPNASPPSLLATRPGGSDKDVGAYGKRITTTVPLVNNTDDTIRVAVRLATPPHGQDGAQIPGHQSYNGPIAISATNGGLHDVKYHAQLGQPGGNNNYQRDTQIAVVSIPPRQNINLRVGLDTHANSQFPLDLVVKKLER